MYKVLIVDDEKLVVESLKRTNIWESEGFIVIDHAYNGITAYSKILELKPDVVFVDIRMPKMNGLELMMKVNEILNAPLFVVISGHAEFAYAQKAITLGALGYCLKPFEPGEIINLLRNIKIRLDKLTAGNVEQLTEMLFDSYSNEKDKFNDNIPGLLGSLGFNLNSSNMISSVTILGKDINSFIYEFKEPGCLILKNGSRKITLLMNQSILNKSIPLFKEKLLSGAADAIGISLPQADPCQLVYAIQQSEESAYQYFINGRGKVFYYKQEEAIKIKDALPILFEKIGNCDYDGLVKDFDNIAERIMSGAGTIRHAYLIYTGMMGYILGKSGDEEKYLLSYQQMVHYYGEFSNLILKLKDYAREAMNPKVVKETGNSVINEIIQYINRNFQKDINIHSISRDFFVNANYFCGLFKKTMGMTFTEYITKLRMDHACDLLKNRNLSIHEISEKVGYDNVYYFNKLFKRSKGMNPSQFRES